MEGCEAGGTLPERSTIQTETAGGARSAAKEDHDRERREEETETDGSGKVRVLSRIERRGGGRERESERQTVNDWRRERKQVKLKPPESARLCWTS